MVAVKSFLDLIEDQGGASVGDPELLRSVRTDIDKIVGLLTDLRLVSSNPADAAFAGSVQLRPALAEILAGLQPAFAARRLEVDNQIPDTLPALQVDKPKFERLFALLLHDELAMLPAGSRLQLAAAEAPVNGRAGLVLTLTDNGPALPQDTLKLVLDPFATQGKPSEYGINLMICLFIVHHHGGTIEVHSAPGGGNTFTIGLPLQPEKISNV